MNTSIEYLAKKEKPVKLAWLTLVDRVVFVRATIVASVIGSVLTLVNQSGWVAGNEPPEMLQLILVFTLPFAVVLVAQVAGIRQAHIDSAECATNQSQESVISTLVSHGIPTRAGVIGLFFGSVNALLTLANSYLTSGNLEAVSIVPLAQAYTLPFLFGLLSQVISYRRARSQGVGI